MDTVDFNFQKGYYLHKRIKWRSIIMKINQITDNSFKKYGKIIKEIDFTELLNVLSETPLTDEIVYIPSVPELESVSVYQELQKNFYGELPIQIGYCNGKNHMLNALEYHRSSEINIAGDDVILLLGSQQDISDDYKYDTSLVEAFLLPKGTAIELYSTTLHFAACSTSDAGHRVVIVLPKDTNLPLDHPHGNTSEDKLLFAKNNWLLAHPEGGRGDNAYIGLTGENLSVK